MFFYRELSQLAATDPYFANVSLLMRGTGTAFERTILDDSLNDLSTTILGGASLSPAVKKNGSYSMYFPNSSQGGTSKLTVDTAGVNFGTGDWTIEAWVYPTALWDYMKIATTRPNNISYSDAFDFGTKADGALYIYSNEFDLLTTAGAIVTNTWQHIAATRQGNTLKIFVNGNLVGTNTNYTKNVTRTLLGIGQFPSANQEAFSGYIDDLRITKGVARYTANFTPPAAELPASSPADPYFANVSLLLRGTGTAVEETILDESPNAFSTTVAGDAVLSSTIKKYGSYSMKFDGSGDYLTVPSSTAFGFGTGDFTIEYWWYPTRNTGIEIMVDTRPSNIAGPYALLGKNSDGSVFCYDGTVRTGGSMTLNAWNHVAWCRNGTSNVVYLNGVSVISFTSGFDAGAARGLTIGANASPAFENCQGYVDDLRITKGVARYTANFTPPVAELPASSPADPDFANVSLLLRGTGTRTERIILDESPNTFSTTIAGNTNLSSAVKKYGSYSINFDGNGDYMTIPSNSAFAFGTGDFAIECWVNINSFSDNITFVDTRDSGNGAGVAVLCNTSGFVWIFGNNANRLFSTNQIPLNTWTHVAFTRESGAIYLYINGVLNNSASWSDNLNNSSMTIGSVVDYRDSGTAYKMKGYIDDLRITKGVARYTANFTPPTEELPAS